ncbi:MAG: SprT family zinc-dependent metalloprotease [Candidatus Saccharimonas sp.]
MSSYIDAEFDEIIIRKRLGTTRVHIRIGTDGKLVVTAPRYTPLMYIKQVVNSSREELRTMLAQTGSGQQYIEGQSIGKSHTLRAIHTGMVARPEVKVTRQTLVVSLPPSHSLTDKLVQRLVRDETIKILRREAKAYLPRRLKYLASEHDFSYERIRFSHSSGRWGSCSSNGTISLNIALMKLPHELIDYVLIHELCHTRQMNHSAAFWSEVERYDPHYRLHRQQIKRETPTV